MIWNFAEEVEICLKAGNAGLKTNPPIEEQPAFLRDITNRCVEVKGKKGMSTKTGTSKGRFPSMRWLRLTYATNLGRFRVNARMETNLCRHTFSKKSSCPERSS